jgi:hypothetical protein
MSKSFSVARVWSVRVSWNWLASWAEGIVAKFATVQIEGRRTISRADRNPNRAMGIRKDARR